MRIFFSAGQDKSNAPSITSPLVMLGTSSSPASPQMLTRLLVALLSAIIPFQIAVLQWLHSASQHMQTRASRARGPNPRRGMGFYLTEMQFWDRSDQLRWRYHLGISSTVFHHLVSDIPKRLPRFRKGRRGKGKRVGERVAMATMYCT